MTIPTIMKKTFAILLIVGFAAGCATSKTATETGEKKENGVAAEAPAPVVSDAENFNTKAVSLASQLSSYLQSYDVGMHTVVVATFVDLGNLRATSRFGRQLSERMVYALHTMGYRVFESRAAKDLLIVENSGEYYLTRNPEKLAAPYKADAVLAGTYETVGDVVTVQVRLIDVATSRIASVATADFNLKADHYTSQLMRTQEDAAMEGAPQGAMEVRELIAEETDPPAQILANKIDTMSRDIVRTLTQTKSAKSVSVASFVDVDKLNRSHTFGRVVAEGLMDRMARRGFHVVEVRSAKEILLQADVGEQALTREPHELKEGNSSEAVLLGTYARVGNDVYVHARLVLPDSRRVVAVGSFQMPIRRDDAFMKQMFENPAERVGSNNFVEGVRQ